MICDICRKNQANIHLTEIINGKVKELHICDTCAQDKGMVKHSKNSGLADFLAGLTDFGITPEDTKALEDFDLRCLDCGLSFEDFKGTGRLGCAGCYEAFKKGLSPLLRKIHGSSCHSEGAPKETKQIGQAIKESDSLEELETKLKAAVKNEEFEDAARLRDAIRSKKKKA